MPPWPISSSTLNRPATTWPISGSRCGRVEVPKPRLGLRVGVTESGVPQNTHTFAVPGGSARAQRGQFAGAAGSLAAAMSSPGRRSLAQKACFYQPVKSLP